MRQCFAAAVLVCAILQSDCSRYVARPVNPQILETRFRARSLADPGLRDFARRECNRAGSEWPPPQIDLAGILCAAMYFSPELDVARAQVEMANASVIAARQRINPSISAEGGYNRTPEAVATWGAASTFTIETAGKRGYRVLEAEKMAESARIALEETRWRIRSNVRSAFAARYFALRRVEALGLQSNIWSELSRLYEQRVTAGESSGIELAAARSQETDAALTLQQEQSSAAQALAALATALGMPAAALEGASFDTQIFEHPPDPESLPVHTVERAGLIHRADIRRMLSEYAAADARLRLELARQYPDLPLSPAYSFQEGFPAYTLGSAIESLPVFHHNQGPIAQAEAARDELKARFILLQSQAIAAADSALRQYRVAVVAWRDARDKLQIIDRAREAQVTAAFRAGGADRIELISARLITLASARKTNEALAVVQTALGALEDAEQFPLDTNARDVVPPGGAEPAK